jgi:glucose-1-phosphate cytidylyltransferase
MSSINQYPVVILCGGLGTRLREETEYSPKPMAAVGGRPILWHIIKSYAFAGFHQFILCLGYKSEIIKEYFLNYEAMNNDFTTVLGKRDSIVYHGNHEEQDITVTLADTGETTNTGGRIKRIERYVDTEAFLVTYGDGLSDIDISDLVAFHHDHGKIATVTAVHPMNRFGVLDLDGNRVLRFAEKPQESNSINAGFFVFNRSFFDRLSPDVDCVLERGPLMNLAHDGELMAYQHDGFFYAMDTYREYVFLNELWDKGTAPWARWRKADD